MNYKRFGYKGEPRTCLWCGARLVFRMVHDEHTDERRKAAIEAGATSWEADKAGAVRAEKAGPYQDDTFCTLSCGYQFGLRMAELGRRLEST